MVTSPNTEKPNKEELQEKDFIQEGYKKNPLPFWIGLSVTAALIALFWGIGSWYYNTMEKQLVNSPFLQVTNREMSVFLWQFPEKMPQHVTEKTGYLPGFEYSERVGLKIANTDDYVTAPPELLFLYHTWSRLLRDEFVQRPINRLEFLEFLELQPEWKPEFWQGAPEGYKRLITGLATTALQNLKSLSNETLPLMVRQAFQGWKNYRYEGELINLVPVKYSILKEFLQDHPDYARNFWRNILEEVRPKYLQTYTSGEYSPDAAIPDDEMAPFLKVALFNYIQAKKGQ